MYIKSKQHSNYFRLWNYVYFSFTHSMFLMISAVSVHFFVLCKYDGTSLVVQWLKIHLSMQGMQVWSLVGNGGECWLISSYQEELKNLDFSVTVKFCSMWLHRCGRNLALECSFAGFVLFFFLVSYNNLNSSSSSLIALASALRFSLSLWI